MKIDWDRASKAGLAAGIVIVILLFYTVLTLAGIVVAAYLGWWVYAVFYIANIVGIGQWFYRHWND